MTRLGHGHYLCSCYRGGAQFWLLFRFSFTSSVHCTVELFMQLDVVTLTVAFSVH
jgi:hypothetical protein